MNKMNKKNAKNELGRISKVILDKKTLNVLSTTKVNQ